MENDYFLPNTTNEFKSRLKELTYLSKKIQNAKNVSIELDNERQKYRECARKIKKNDINPVWVFNGTTFLKTNQQTCLKIIDDDSKTVETAINEIKNVIKVDMDTLLRLKGEKGIEERGFDLKPLVIDGKLS